MTSKVVKKAIAVADGATLYLALTVLAIVVLTAFREEPGFDADAAVWGMRLRSTSGHPCDEIYVVGEGETLHAISDKCDGPFIVEQNPHMHDPDEVLPGLVIRITPSGTKY